MAAKVSRNIPLLYLIKICKWFMLYMPVVILYYINNHLTTFDLFFLHGVYSLVIALLEIPSGYMSDVWGRKPTMMAGLFFGFIGFGVYSLTAGRWGFLLAEVMLGIGQSFISGNDTALLYDSLQQENKQHKYLKHEGRMTSVGNFSEGLAGIVVSLLALSTIRYYYYLQTLLSLIALLGAFFLVEPTLRKYYRKVEWNDIVDTVKVTLLKHPQLSRYVLFSSFIGFASLSMAWFAQTFLYTIGIKNSLYGYIWSALNFIVSLGAFASVQVDRVLGIRKSLIAMLVMLVGGFFLASQMISFTGLALLSLFYFARGFAHPILKSQINKLATSDVRATILSVRSLSIRILFTAFSPLFGWMTNKINLSFALMLCGTTILIPGIVLVVGIFKNQKLSVTS